MDIVNLEYGNNIVAWYENTDGLGSFGPKRIISNINYPKKIVAKDLDNDGDIDLASINHYNNDSTTAVYWHENTDGLGNFSPEQIISSDILGGRGIDAADLDNDGDIDVLSASIIDYKIAWYENFTILEIEDNDKMEFSIYPNPTDGIIYFESISEVVSIKVYDTLGRLVLKKDSPSNTLDISNLSTGLLFVHIDTDEGSVVKKVIKE